MASTADAPAQAVITTPAGDTPVNVTRSAQESLQRERVRTLPFRDQQLTAIAIGYDMASMPLVNGARGEETT
jgi:hypothetical protein